LRTSLLLGKCSSTWNLPPSLLFLGLLWDTVLLILPRLAL
jgi:hypothetical protein